MSDTRENGNDKVEVNVGPNSDVVIAVVVEPFQVTNHPLSASIELRVAMVVRS